MQKNQKSKREKISIVIPTLNEEQNIKKVLDELEEFFRNANYDYEIIIVDGYSKDRTVEIAKKYKNVKVLFDDKGKGSALVKGMKSADGDIIISMDADCSHSANELNLLIAGIKAGYDACMGSRFLQGGGSEDITLLRKFGNKFFVMLVNLLYGSKYSDLCYGYRSFRKEAVQKLDLKEEGFGIETEINIKAIKNGLKVVEVPSFEKKRGNGTGKLKTFRDGWVILNVILKNLFS